MQSVAFFDLPKDVLRIIFSPLKPIELYSLSLTCKDCFECVSNLYPDMGIIDNLGYILRYKAANCYIPDTHSFDVTNIDRFLRLFTEKDDYAIFGSLLVCAMSIPVSNRYKCQLPFIPQDIDLFCHQKYRGTNAKRSVTHIRNSNGVSNFVRGLLGRGTIERGQGYVYSSVVEKFASNHYFINVDIVWTPDSFFADHLDISTCIEFTKVYWKGGLPHVKDIKSLLHLTSTVDDVSTKHVKKWSRRECATIVYRARLTRR